MITRAHCMRFLGQYVYFRTRDGVAHHGVLHSVTNDGIYVRPVSGGNTRLARLLCPEKVRGMVYPIRSHSVTTFVNMC